MKIFGIDISRVKTKSQSLSAVDNNRGWMRIFGESFGGAWQRFINVDSHKDILAFSAVYACVTIIATDIAKLGLDLMAEDANGINSEVTKNSPYLPVLRKPNRYQTMYKFIEQWIVSKLLYGNAYILKEKNQQEYVTALYVLDANRVTVLVADNGDVYYRLARDTLSGLEQGSIVVPASEIIHDMMVSLWHPLVGVSPIYACGMSATMGNRIQSNSTTFFQNMSRPSGMLTAPSTIDDVTAERLKTTFEEKFSNGGLGRLFVGGDGLTYSAMTIPAADAQLIEQLKWTVEDVARCFHVPMYKLGGQEPPRVTVESLNQTYYSDCLQGLIESAEALLNDGLGLDASPSTYYSVEFDLDNLLRMDTGARYTAKGQAVKDGWLAPNEARASEDLPPVDGGDSPLMQQQNYSLAALAKRDAREDPFATSPSPTSSADPASDTTAAQNADTTAAQNADNAASQGAAALLDYIAKGLEYA